MESLLAYSGSSSEDESESGCKASTDTSFSVTSSDSDHMKKTDLSSASHSTKHLHAESTVGTVSLDFFNLTDLTNNVMDEKYNSQVQNDFDQNVVPSEESTVDFWKADTVAEDWTNPEKIWGVNFDHTDTEFCGKNVSSVSSDKCRKIEGYKSKRHRCDSFSEKPDCSESSVTRKCFMVHHKIAPHLHTVKQVSNRIPKKIFRTLPGHSGTINRINWNIPEYGHLLLTASMDATVRVWNVFSSQDFDSCVRTLKVHSKAVRGALWSACGRQVLSCSYDKSVKLIDAEHGSEVCCFQHQDHVNCIKFNPVDHNVFVSGLTNLMCCWDKRCPSKPVRQYVYKDKIGQVQDICFLEHGSQFLTCNDVVGRDSPDRTIMVWDFSSGAVLSNQIYQERYTCTRLCVHPTEPKFFAQTNGDYIAEFSTSAPYKINRCKRFEGHKVSGYSVGCDASPDGKFVVSGSADNRLVIYDYRFARMLCSLPVPDVSDVVLDVAWHPVLFSTVAAGTWNGHVVLWQ